MSDKLMRKIIHIDMDCFYAAIEMRDFPELAEKPLAVGGDANKRGVISTCNYLARKFGIHSAMPTMMAYKLCPQLVVQPVRIDIYKQESFYIRKIFSDYTDKIEPLSLDEAYLDVTDSSSCQGSATWIAKEIRRRIFETRALTASAGVAPTKSLAKIASDWNKPNGQKVITPDEVFMFVYKLPVRKLFGVGPVLEKRLADIGIFTCGQVQALSKKDLRNEFGLFGEKLYDLARGVDDRPVISERIRKSISVEETYLQDLMNVESCLKVMPELLKKLGARINREKDLPQIHNIFIKLKFNDFQQTTVEQISDSLNSQMISKLIQEGWNRKKLPVRLIGVGIKLDIKCKEIPKQMLLPCLSDNRTV